MFSFPWSNFHELNLDWILSVVKEAKDIFVKGEGDIQHAVETADQALETAEQAAAGVIADGAVTIPKVNDDVFNLMAFIVSGSVNPVAIPAGSLVILRKSTVYNVSDGIYVAASDISASSVLTAADLLQPSPLPDAGGLNYVLAQIGDTETSIDAIQRGLVTVVDGDTATSAVPVGALAYLKNNTHNLQEGIYANISNAPFPTTGGTADSSVFSAVPNVLNSIRDITGDGVLTDFTATDLTGAANELKNALNQLDYSESAIEDSIAYVQDGDTASRTYTAGQFIYLKNHPTLAEGLYTVNSGGIPQNTSVTGHLTADTSGGLNALSNEMKKVLYAAYSTTITSQSSRVTTIPAGIPGYKLLSASFDYNGDFYYLISSDGVQVNIGVSGSGSSDNAVFIIAMNTAGFTPVATGRTINCIAIYSKV